MVIDPLSGGSQRTLEAHQSIRGHFAEYDPQDVTSQTVESFEALLETEVWSEAAFFIIAGGITSSATLTTLFFYLTRYLEAYDKLAAEIRTTFPSGRAIRGGPQLRGCMYLRVVIGETLRMSPASLGTFGRELDPAQDPDPDLGKPFVVDGHVVPPGTAVGVSPYSVLHNPEYFPDPFVFRPERWLEDLSRHVEDEATSRATTMRRAFAPFALGDRGCAGKPVAYLELSLMLARTIWSLNFAKGPGLRAGEGEAGRVPAV